LEKHRAWIFDLEQRLAYHLFFNSEKEEEKPSGKRVIEVVEDEVKIGGWLVFFNGKKAFTFDGPDARKMALRTAEDLSKET
jgi:hypothetical protein